MPDATPRRNKVDLEEVTTPQAEELTPSETESVQGGTTLLGTKPTASLVPDPDPCAGDQFTRRLKSP